MPLFILEGCKKLPPEPEPLEACVYDEERQLWADENSNIPLVCLWTCHSSSRYGETTLTETREGADQSEVVACSASRFGETTLTKTAEGADQSEISSLVASRFGETQVTATREGADAPEVASASRFGETTMTRAQEGHDQFGAKYELAEEHPNIASACRINRPLSLHASYSHF